MCKRVMLGLAALSLGALVWTDANAGCCCNPLRCASYITGSGMPTGLVTAPTGPEGFEPSDGACPTVMEFQPSRDEEFDGGLGILQVPTPVTSLRLRLVGTVGTDCGLGETDSAFCDIQGVAVCGASVSKKVSTPGPLTVLSGDGFAQTDSSTNSANLRFQLNTSQQRELCPDDTFVAFFAREGFFETCVNGTGPDDCVREFCKVDVGGINRDVPRTYNCQPV